MSSMEKDFQFELSETLYFDRGDEVLELIGISLNPEVTIHTYESYVSIRGQIDLHGEYIRDTAASESENDHYSFEELEAKRYVELVESRENNIAEFSHSFPVDISVPAYRIESMEDVRIEIINFDYEFPENSKLQFTAIAEIQGIKAEVELVRDEDNRESEIEIPEDAAKPFEFELKRQETEFTEDELVENERSNREVEVNEEELLETEEREYTQEDLLDETNEEDAAKPFEFELKRQETEFTEDELVENERSNREVEVNEEELLETEEREYTQEDLLDETNEEDVEEDVIEVRENELTIRAMEQQGREGSEGEDQSDDNVKDVSYLTDIFRDEQEESYTRMKICIVQEDDTIETIAERFQISALQLIKQNKLDENFDISEGQLLYIPKK
ncbi:stage VI sporulation protein D [Oceanobacillus luteolus]|uniref:stage VI sporulation protein D n=1 Tax=Oceanobacillus luteolus TaxID=1274358 RepID=UPI00203F7077|nr:stage VI sporulation protein D [Oceanobacillus luteolus]MCM3739943.1 stage VI sporulation protein D [Oceanobacillus luteolus]